MHINQLIIASLRSEAGEAELRELEAWRGESPGNERHYQEFLALWRLTEGGDSMATSPPPGPADLIDTQARPGSGVVRLMPGPGDRPDAAHRTARSGRWWWMGAASAAAVLLGFGFWTLAPLSRSPGPVALIGGADEFVTGASEAATVELRDGSVVRLAPNSRLVLSSAGDQREVALTGRAYFTVAPDPARPFRIGTESGTVTVIGTRFDLHSEGDDLRLVVVDGLVALDAGDGHVEVGAGEMSRVEGGALTPKVAVPDVHAAVDWLGTFLAFQATPLSRAATEIERAYGVRVMVHGALAEQTVTGWFADRTLEQVLRVVCPVVAARCASDGELVRMEPLPGGDEAPITETPGG